MNLDSNLIAVCQVRHQIDRNTKVAFSGSMEECQAYVKGLGDMLEDSGIVLNSLPSGDETGFMWEAPNKSSHKVFIFRIRRSR